MKHALVAAALLLTSTLALAANEGVNMGDPQLTRTSAEAAQECWKAHAARGDTSQVHLIHANADAPSDSTVESRARSVRAI